MFAGEPAKDGWLVAKTDPVPDAWDDIYVPPINAFPTTIMPYTADGPQRLAAERAKIDAAPRRARLRSSRGSSS